MPGFLSRLKARDGLRKKKNGMQDLTNALPQKPKWGDAYTRASVEPEEVHELLHVCTDELKARGTSLATSPPPPTPNRTLQLDMVMCIAKLNELPMLIFIALSRT